MHRAGLPVGEFRAIVPDGFHGRKLGNYRALATDPAKSVVLKFRDRMVVVTPGDPEKFAHEITAKN